MSAQVATQAPVAAVPPASAPSAAAAVPTGTRHAARRRARQRWLRRVVLGVSLTLLALPIVALLEFSVRYPLTGAVDLDAWRKIVSGRTSEYQTLAPLWTGLTNSLVMCAITVTLMLVLLLPTMVWVQLRRPRLGRALELVCLLPLTIPAVVLVVGLAPVYRVISTRVLDSSTIWLSFAYVILVLPFAYRALAAGLRSIDLVTLSEAARSFGASWWVVLVRVVAPNIRSAIVSACFLSVAVVLGEFTLARILARDNLQTALFQINLSDSQVAAAMAFLALVGTTVLLVVVDLLMSRSRPTRPHAPGVTAS
ncbi:ABC transporter permease [Flavimobilis marinus]|uniref:Putative spermidine/putrescine transport system permease protein n=1 Tax=Flavimobilis marinus TaxID=285351 RepID=A0A1I2G6J8_9MICO|nr:ABC transporter permease subunit [Flavimobilis marinus]GHG50157.1 ABC transporter permease [Flavimobilis marinus]SFF12346.1 putative spermidine/putrescine transport system permease protein [Flavimobilis marinus]